MAVQTAEVENPIDEKLSPVESSETRTKDVDSSKAKDEGAKPAGNDEEEGKSGYFVSLLKTTLSSATH